MLPEPLPQLYHSVTHCFCYQCAVMLQQCLGIQWLVVTFRLIPPLLFIAWLPGYHFSSQVSTVYVMRSHFILCNCLLIWSAVHMVAHAINFYKIGTQPPIILRCVFPALQLDMDFMPKFDYWIFQTVPGACTVNTLVLVWCCN